jgi:hypothetical protein
MSFTMPPAPPPTLTRKPFDLKQLPPEMQARIAAEGQVTLEDGSAIFADGTSSGAGDSPNDFAGGGYGGGPATGMGYQPQPDPLMAGAPDPSLGIDPALVEDPFASPQFDRYFNTANAGFPGTPGGVGGPVDNNPMGEPMLDPFADAPQTEVSQPFLLGAGPVATPPTAAVDARRQMGGVQAPAGTVGAAPAGYGGRVGRNRTSQPVSSRPLPGGRRR